MRLENRSITLAVVNTPFLAEGAFPRFLALAKNHLFQPDHERVFIAAYAQGSEYSYDVFSHPEHGCRGILWIGEGRHKQAARSREPESSSHPPQDMVIILFGDDKNFLEKRINFCKGRGDKIRQCAEILETGLGVLRKHHGMWFCTSDLSDCTKRDKALVPKSWIFSEALSPRC